MVGRLLEENPKDNHTRFFIYLFLLHTKGTEHLVLLVLLVDGTICNLIILVVAFWPRILFFVMGLNNYEFFAVYELG